MELQQIGRSFDLPGDNGKEITRKVILDQVNLQVAEGEFLAILGPSGSGKSTLLRIIAGLIPATTGTVSYLGEPVQGINAGVGMVFQSFACFPGSLYWKM